jgi:hypothetical protein
MLLIAAGLEDTRAGHSRSSSMLRALLLWALETGGNIRYTAHRGLLVPGGYDGNTYARPDDLLDYPVGNFIYHAYIIDIDRIMELRYSTGRAEVDGKIITSLDKFVIGFVRLLEEHNIKHVIVSGYVAILFGRARGTEDIDILVERMDASGFLSFYKSTIERGYDFLNPEDATGLYEMLCERLGIRAAEKDTVIPNMEMKFAKDDFDRYALSHRLEAVFNGESIYISPIELQIPYKLYLGSEKDIEDAIYLWDIFQGKLDVMLLKRFMMELKVSGEAYGIVI